MWIPDQETMDADREEFQVFLYRRYNEIVQDMNESGYPHLIWLDWSRDLSRTELNRWLDARDHRKCYVGQALRVCFAFKKPCDRLLFKLTWVGL